jgi:hypothetical protein
MCSSEVLKPPYTVKFARRERLVAQAFELFDAFLNGPLLYPKRKGYDSSSAVINQLV